ncbi:GNAT family N-acetyltransferase [Actinoplanes subtropicus]|uniref:GNAT family N-acetyltransferase n=1 Tax=Actinoplanes subtropicus TaxID=543632 RepID=UPI0004C3AC8F|nr:GNAT family N-acetyltransferase [Actinoplanes subtropicus]
MVEQASPRLTIRDASEADAAACVAIYRPFVLDTAVSFETTPPTEPQMAARIREAAGTHAWLVAELGGEVAGYAYARPFAAREAYRWSCETSIYLSPAHRGAGVGRSLYEALLARLVERGYRVAVAKMTLPNPASEGLHASLGFRPVGVHRRIGFKNGAWYDIAITQRELAPATDHPAEPR